MKKKQVIILIALSMVIILLCYNLIKYPLRTTFWKIVGISSEETYELYLWHYGEEVQIKDETLKDELLEYLSGTYKRGMSDYIMKSAGGDWVIRVKHQDKVVSMAIFTGENSENSSIKYGAYRYLISNDIPKSFLESIFVK
ncbi:hypothetical protein [Lachnoclostridium phytofermentans]|nr:hypothetical protein [Lachnoclostridium phytofermentans]